MPSALIQSTLGFIYTPDFQKVLLIEKQKPAFHKNKLNGLGGKCEAGEDLLTCISREVKEESGLEILRSDWQRIGNINWTEWDVAIFAAIYKGNPVAVSSLIEGNVAWYSVHSLPKNIISNLSWLVPLGIDCLTNETPPIATIHY